MTPRREPALREITRAEVQMAMIAAQRESGARGWLGPGYTLRPYVVRWFKFVWN